MPLDPLTVLALAPACAPGVAPATLLAVAQVESGLDPLAIGVNTPGVPRPRPSSRREAARHAEALIAAGRNIDLGLGQINVRNLGWLGLSVPDAFDPCRSLAASARVLEAGYRRAGPGPGREQQALRTALSFYNTGDAVRGFRNGYVARVTAAAGRFVPALVASADRHAAAEPASPPRWDVFAHARLRSATFVLTPVVGAQP